MWGSFGFSGKSRKHFLNYLKELNCSADISLCLNTLVFKYAQIIHLHSYARTLMVLKSLSIALPVMTENRQMYPHFCAFKCSAMGHDFSPPGYQLNKKLSSAFTLSSVSDQIVSCLLAKTLVHF